MTATARFEGPSDFAIFLRTGLRFRHQAGADVEVKFNPWHDPDDGQFTFAGRGRYFGEGEGLGASGSGRAGGGRGGGAVGSWGSNTPRSNARPAQRTPAPTPQPKSRTWRGGGFSGGGGGDFGGGGATGSGWETREEQRAREAREARLRAMAAARRLTPAVVARRPNTSVAPQPPAERRHRAVHNGYTFETDDRGLVRRVSGQIPFEGRTKRSPSMQLAAGGSDRRPTDDGGHYVAPRFNGPRIQINHFPQNLSVNRGEYRVLEDRWDKARDEHRKVVIDIRPVYPRNSQRLDGLRLVWVIDGVSDWIFLRNEKTVKKNVRRIRR